MTKTKNPAAVALGKLGGAARVSKGIGKLSPEERIERAKAGAAAMWAKRRKTAKKGGAK